MAGSPTAATWGIASVPIGTEQTIAVASRGGVWVFAITATAFVPTDIFAVRMYSKVNPSGPEEIVFGPYQIVGASQTVKTSGVVSPPLATTEWVKCTVEGVQGSTRGFHFSLMGV